MKINSDNLRTFLQREEVDGKYVDFKFVFLIVCF